MAGRMKNELREEIKTMLQEGVTSAKISKQTGVSEKSIQKIADSLDEGQPEASAEEAEDSEEANEIEVTKGSATFWEKKADFWKAKYLETWADLIEIQDME